MRQYVILYRRAPAPDFVRLKPDENAGFYDRDAVCQAIDFMRGCQAAEAIYVRIEDEAFQIVSFTQEALAPNAFTF